MNSKGMIVLGVALAIGTAGPLAAQNQAPAREAPAGRTPIDAEQFQAWFAEAQELSQRLAALQQRVLADTQIARERDALTARVEQAMAEADPTLEEELARARDLEPAMAAAQEAGDDARLEQLVSRARDLESRFIAAQRAALEDPELSRIVLSFNERVRERMTELDAETPGLLERLEELGALLQPQAQ